MKIFNYKVASIVLALGLLFSCESVELDLTENNNAASPDNANANFLLNNVQEEFARFVDGFNATGAQVTRVEYMSGRQYVNAFSPQGFNGQWSRAYANMLTDIYTMYPIAEEGELYNHIGMAKVMEAYIMVTLVDFFGDVPYSEALQGAANFNPAADSGDAIYAAALTRLNEAIAAFNADSAADPDFDLYYFGEWDNWIKLANSLKIKIYAQSRLVDGSAVSAINTIINSGNYISDISEDFEFHWGSNLTNPDTRHPRYGGNYIATGAGDYMSNWLMGYMQSDKVDNGNGTFDGTDPRMRYYFYRQFACTPGNGCIPNQQELTCSVEPIPAHYAAGGYSFCNLPDGYWGRDHGDDDGIPPDGLKRTTWGVYPFGGRFDDDTFQEVNQGLGGGGAGITPILQSSTIDFIRAELAYAAGNTGAARDFMLAGITKSFAKVRSFGDLDGEADLSVAAPASDDAAYIAEVGELYDAATGSDKLDILAKEFWVTLFGNGIDAYNFYRRVGAPFDIQPNLEPDPGSFIRSFFYPADYVNNNSSASQKANVSTKVFWDTNPDSGFPSAN